MLLLKKYLRITYKKEPNQYNDHSNYKAIRFPHRHFHVRTVTPEITMIIADWHSGKANGLIKVYNGGIWCHWKPYDNANVTRSIWDQTRSHEIVRVKNNVIISRRARECYSERIKDRIFTCTINFITRDIEIYGGEKAKCDRDLPFNKIAYVKQLKATIKW
jgi:hypothetical protein